MPMRDAMDKVRKKKHLASQFQIGQSGSKKGEKNRPIKTTPPVWPRVKKYPNFLLARVRSFVESSAHATRQVKGR